MAITLVNTGTGLGGGGGSSWSSSSFVINSGNLLIAIAAIPSSGGTVLTVADTAGNTYTRAAIAVASATSTTEIWYAKNSIANASGSITMTWGTAASNVAVHALQYSGINTLAPLDVAGSAVGTSAAANSGTITTTGLQDELLISAVRWAAAGSTAVAANSFTLQTIIGTQGGISTPSMAEDRIINGAPGQYFGSATTDASLGYGMVIASFLPAGGHIMTPMKGYW
jgi:hypothetical protein